MTRSVIIANHRTGGTFLAWCLSNHPDIHCERGEILHHLHPMRAFIAGDALSWVQMILSMQFYQVSMCKLTYSQAFNKGIWGYLKKAQPHVIWLRRENLLHQAVSFRLLKSQRRAHSCTDLPPTRIQIEPGELLQSVANLDARNLATGNALKAMKHILPVTYAEITGQGNVSEMAESAGRRICSFLGVPYYPMGTLLKRVNPYPLSETLTNWPEIEAAFRGTKYATFLGGDG